MAARPARVRSLPALAVAALVIFGAACGGDSDGTFVLAPGEGSEQVDSIAVSPLTARLEEVGLTQPFTATAFDASGAVLTGVDLDWSSEDPGVASVDQDGVATARGPGQVDIRASAGDVTGRAVLTVAPIIEP